MESKDLEKFSNFVIFNLKVSISMKYDIGVSNLIAGFCQDPLPINSICMKLLEKGMFHLIGKLMISDIDTLNACSKAKSEREVGGNRELKKQYIGAILGVYGGLIYKYPQCIDQFLNDGPVE